MRKTTVSKATMSEATLWRLYRRLLAERQLCARLPAPATKSIRSKAWSAAVTSALTENLAAGDTLGLRDGDLATRYLCGVPLTGIRGSGQRQGSRRSGEPHGSSWALAADAEHGILPGSGAGQAMLAAGTALASRLHDSPPLSISVLLDHGPRRQASVAPKEAWSSAVKLAVSLALPMLFITSLAHGVEEGAAIAGPAGVAALLPTIPVDGEDAVALYRVIYESAARARSGGGPTWIDARDAILSTEERKRNKSAPSDASPLARLEQIMRGRSIFDAREQRHLERAIASEFSRADWPVTLAE